jgi:hypothetical protein
MNLESPKKINVAHFAGRITMILFFIVYFFLPNDTFGKTYIDNLAYGYMTGALALAVPAFIIFFPVFLIGSAFLKKNKNFDQSQEIQIDTQELQRIFHISFYLCALSSILLMIYYTHSHQQDDWSVWITTIVASLEIMNFIIQGRSQDKAKFYLRHLLSSVFLYGILIYISLKDVDSFHYTPMKEYFLPVSIGHLIVELLLEIYVINKNF